MALIKDLLEVLKGNKWGKTNKKDMNSNTTLLNMFYLIDIRSIFCSFTLMGILPTA